MNTEANKILIQKIVQNGKDPADFESWVKRIVEAIPAAERAAFGEDDTEAAVAYADTYFDALNTDASVGSPTETQGAAFESKPIGMSAEQQNLLDETTASLVKPGWAEKSTIVKLLVEKPAPSSYIPEGTKVVPTCKPNNRQKYESNVWEDDKAALAEVMAAVDNGTPIEVYVNDSNRKIVGAKVNRPSGEPGQETNIDTVYTKEKLIGYILGTLEANPIPPNPANGLAAQVKASKPRATTKVSTRIQEGAAVPRLIFSGKTKALEDPNAFEVISTQSGEVQTGKLRITKTFKIRTNKFRQDGTEIIRTVRLTGDYNNMPVWKRTTDEYSRLFPFRSAFGGSGQTKLNPEETRKALAGIILSDKSSVYGLDDLAAKFKELSVAKATAADDSLAV
jgi:hypothetical protein